jgi:hypothetical protein
VKTKIMKPWFTEDGRRVAIERHVVFVGEHFWDVDETYHELHSLVVENESISYCDSEAFAFCATMKGVVWLKELVLTWNDAKTLYIKLASLRGFK